MRRVLVLGYIYSPFLCTWLLKMAGKFKDSIFEVISRNKENPIYKDRIRKTENIKLHLFDSSGFIDSVPKVRALELKNLLKKRKLILSADTGDYLDFPQKTHPWDITHIQYAGSLALFLSKAIIKRSRKIIVSHWGGNIHINGLKGWMLWWAQQRLWKAADRITFITPEVMKEFDHYHGYEFHDKLRVCRFGSPIFDRVLAFDKTTEQAKQHFNIPEDHITVALGYNSQPNQQHFKILDNLKNLPKNVILLVPTQFGGDARYRKKLKKRVRESGIKHRFFDFISNDEMVLLRKATDIMIQVQKNDALSASMQEILALGNLVITGNWLKYDSLKDAFMLKMPSVETIRSYLPYAIEHLPGLKERCKSNRKVVQEWFNNERIMNEWVELYEKLEARI